VLEQFHRWIKVFRKKASKRMLMRKMWDYVIDLKKGFMLRKGIFYFLFQEERRGKEVYSRADEEGIYLTVKVTTDSTSILYGKEG